jgi:hypothetical protein
MKYVIAVLAAQVIVFLMIMSSRYDLASTGPRGGQYPIPVPPADQMQQVSTGPRGGQYPIPVPPTYQSPYWYNHYNARMNFDPSDERPISK